eukprot:s595_g8.t1
MLLVEASDAERLDSYSELIRGFVRQYGEEAWPFISQADSRLRSEHLERLKRELRATPAFGFEENRPWAACFAAAVKDNEYWQRELATPALLYLTRNKRDAPPRGSEPARASGDPPSSKKARAKRRHQGADHSATRKRKPPEEGPAASGQQQRMPAPPGEDAKRRKTEADRSRVTGPGPSAATSAASSSSRTPSGKKPTDLTAQMGMGYGHWTAGQGEMSGLPANQLKPVEQRQLKEANILVDRSAVAAETQTAAGKPWGWENPDHGEEKVSMWKMPKVKKLRESESTSEVNFDQCRTDLDTVKPTKLLLHQLDLTQLDGMRCNHPTRTFKRPDGTEYSASHETFKRPDGTEYSASHESTVQRWVKGPDGKMERASRAQGEYSPLLCSILAAAINAAAPREWREKELAGERLP